jgi:hypothetical protein
MVVTISATSCRSLAIGKRTLSAQAGGTGQTDGSRQFGKFLNEMTCDFLGSLPFYRLLPD